jgi:hypothetical protein
MLGGNGLVKTKMVNRPAVHGHGALAASPSTGVDATTGQGWFEALACAEVIVEVSNSPSFEGAADLDFFENSRRNLMRAEADGARNFSR